MPEVLPASGELEFDPYPALRALEQAVGRVGKQPDECPDSRAGFLTRRQRVPGVGKFR
jgi:hypothetical protein